MEVRWRLRGGARRLSAEEFEAQIVQRMVIGPTATGASLEILYTTNGTVVGTGSSVASALAQGMPLNGEWKFDDPERICTAMQLTTTGGGAANMNLPSRCQHWLELGNVYFISDSDTDRRAKVLRRTLKP